VDMIRSLRARHPGQRIVAFSEYASTIAAFFARLRSDAGVGMLTSHGARIASGRIARDDLLGRFAPRAQRVAPAEHHQSVTLLLTTDILSEGVNLQDASIVLHLDLPWNPARLAQRVGRVRRPGGAKVVRTYLLAPPAHADALLTADARLRRKLEQARLVVGIGFNVLPSLSSTSPQVMRDVQTMDSRATVTGALIETLQRWQSEDGREQGRRCDDDSGLTGALTSDDLRIAVQAFRELRVGAAVYHQRGWLAAQHAPSELVTQVAPLVSAAAGEPRLPDDVEVWAAVTMLDRWLSQQELLATCGLSEQPGPIRRAVLSHLASIIRRTPRHAHARVLSVVSRLRHHLSRPMPLCAEQALLREVVSAVADIGAAPSLLATAARGLEASASARTSRLGSGAMPRLVAMIVLGPPGEDTQA
jgi:hypothetical protein